MIEKLLLAAGIAFAVVLPAAAQNAAVVNGKAIPSARVDEIIAQMKKANPDQPDLKDKSKEAELRNQVREELIMREVFMQEAMKLKLTERPDIKLAIENARQRVIMTALAQEYLSKNKVTDQEIQAEYDKVKKERGGTEYHAHHILVDTEDEAKAIVAKLKGGAKFEELAKQSKDPGSAANGGDLDWAPASNYVPEFAGALQALKKGEMTDTPIKTKYGWHIIRLDDTRAAQFPPLEQVKSQIAEMLQQQKLGDYQKKLRQSAKVQ